MSDRAEPYAAKSHAAKPHADRPSPLRRLFPNTVQGRFLAVNLPLIAVSLIAIVGLFAALHAQSRIDDLNDRMVRLAHSEAAVLADSLWHFDLDRVALILEAITADDHVVRAAVYNEFGQFMSGAGATAGSGGNGWSVREQPIFRPDDASGAAASEPIGSLVLDYSDDLIFDEMREDLYWSAILAVCVLISAIVSALVANWRAIGRPLDLVLNAIERSENDSARERIDWARNDEFGELIDAFNRSQQRQEIYEKELRSRRLDLEIRVAERTKELVKARDDACEADRAKTSFLRGMSHELRTPLNAIIGFSDMIRLGVNTRGDEDKAKAYARDINASAHHLLEIVDDLLDLSSIETDDHVMEESLFPIAEVVTESLDIMQGSADQKHVRFSWDGSERPATVLADRRALRQILLNLLSNAVRHVNDGGDVSVRTRVEADLSVTFEVSDDGPGIDPKRIGEIMRPFGAIGDPMISRSEGAGLGLPISRGLIELHGGTMKIESELGRGATVRFTLPSQRTQAIQPDGARIA